MADSQFYIHLPSDSSLGVYPDNTVAKFSTKLSKMINLDGSYEVGLSELIYPTDYYNIDNREKHFKFGIRQLLLRYDEEQEDEIIEEKFVVKRLIKSDLYYSEEEFLAGINQQINNDNTTLRIPAKIEFTIDDTGRVCIEVVPLSPSVTLVTERGSTDYLFFVLSAAFSKRLGYDGMVSLNLRTPYKSRAKHKFDLYMGKKLMYVYSDIVSHSLVGDVSVPLLRACNLPQPSSNSSVHLSFPDIHYKPVQKCQFDTIDISINTEEGLLMPFQSGKVLITLHFRRVHKLPLK